MSRRFFASDHHFYHLKIITHYGRSKFSSLEEMHETIISNWNKAVRPKDIVYCVGDFSFGNFEKTRTILSRLNGRKFLIRGNHDKLSTLEYLNAGFEDVSGELHMTLSCGERVLIKHYPYDISPIKKMWKKVTRTLGSWRDYYLFYPVDKGYFLIHGHTHGGQRIRGRQINVTQECWNYHPVSEAAICNLIKTQKESSFIIKIKKIVKVFLLKNFRMPKK